MVIAINRFILITLLQLADVEPASPQSTQFENGINEEQEIDDAIGILSSSASPSSYHNISDDGEPNITGSINYLSMRHFLMKNMIIACNAENNTPVTRIIIGKRRFHFSIFVLLC